MWCNALLQCVVGGLPLGAGDDEQYKEEQPREGLFLAEAMNCWRSSATFLSLSLLCSDRPTDPSNEPILPTSFLFSPPCGWLVLFIVALVLFPNIEPEGSQQWRASLKGNSKYQLS